MARQIAGVFQDRNTAERAIEDLKANGFPQDHISFVMRDRSETRDVVAEQGVNSTAGAVTGGLIGGTAGAIVAATGAFVIPGIGPFISGGILATSLVGGAAGWLVGGLLGLGIPREEAEYYEGRLKEGGALVVVDAQGRDREARQILMRNGAEDLRERGYGGGYTDDQTAGATMTDQRADTNSFYPATNTGAPLGAGSVLEPDPADMQPRTMSENAPMEISDNRRNRDATDYASLNDEQGLYRGAQARGDVPADNDPTRPAQYARGNVPVEQTRGTMGRSGTTTNPDEMVTVNGQPLEDTTGTPGAMNPNDPAYRQRADTMDRGYTSDDDILRDPPLTDQGMTPEERR